jgi:hypothetical protein
MPLVLEDHLVTVVDSVVVVPATMVTTIDAVAGSKKSAS